MNCIILDTSTNTLHLAIANSGSLIAWSQQVHHNQVSVLLIPSIHHILQENKLTLKDLHYLAVGTGPGSFTGTRVAAITAMSLAFALEIPLIGFSSTLLDEKRSIITEKVHKKFLNNNLALSIDYTRSS